MIDLPEGYVIGTTKRSAVRAQGSMLGSEWQLVVYNKGHPAFKLAKQYHMNTHRIEYAGKLVSIDGAWHLSYDLRELVLLMCAKHRILGV